ncbi:glycosyltransferase [Desulfogranum japonicum]|uniref:glycosyltransferase n=1 Tax=Desulfogranum japonicum TaxID=231447 RepID=UPI00040C40DF|nr:glycosyltransferase [Desulfogranum japonicum]
MELNARKQDQKENRVLLLAPQPFYQERGTPMNVRLMCTILGKAGYKVDLLVFPTGSSLEIPGVRIFRVPNVFRLKRIAIGFSMIKLMMDAVLIPYAVFLCLRNRYHVVHGIEEGGVVAVALGKLFACKSVYDMDSVISAQFSTHGLAGVFQRFISLVEKLAIRKASLVLTVCESLSVHAGNLQPGGQIVQIEDIPLDFAFPLSEEKKMASMQTVTTYLKDRQLLDKQLFVYTGNLESYQGIDLMLEAWQQACLKSENMSDARLVIVGGAEGAVDAYRRKIKEQQGLEGVLFVGQRPAEEMGAWMQHAYCLLSPRAEGENTPLKIYSYMSSGKPVIATNIVSHTQVLSDATAVMVAPEADVMGKAFIQVVQNADDMAAKGMAARQDVASRFGYEVFSAKLLAAYAELVKKRSDRNILG